MFIGEKGYNKILFSQKYKTVYTRMNIKDGFDFHSKEAGRSERKIKFDT